MLLTVRVGGEVKKMMGVDLRPAADGLQLLPPLQFLPPSPQPQLATTRTRLLDFRFDDRVNFIWTGGGGSVTMSNSGRPRVFFFEQQLVQRTLSSGCRGAMLPRGTARGRTSTSLLRETMMERSWQRCWLRALAAIGSRCSRSFGLFGKGWRDNCGCCGCERERAVYGTYRIRYLFVHWARWVLGEWRRRTWDFSAFSRWLLIQKYVLSSYAKDIFVNFANGQ